MQGHLWAIRDKNVPDWLEWDVLYTTTKVYSNLHSAQRTQLKNEESEWKLNTKNSGLNSDTINGRHDNNFTTNTQ